MEKPEANSERVYIIREADDTPGSYVGWTDKPFHIRLGKHNDGTGAIETRGKQWKPVRVLKGFNNRAHAKSFETTMQQEYNEVSCWQERLKVAESIMKLAEFQFVHIDPNPMLALPSTGKEKVKKDWKTQKKAAAARRAASLTSTSTSASPTGEFRTMNI